MGCDEVRTMEAESDESSENDGHQSLLKKIYTGFLQKDVEFEDCIIKNQEELDDKLRSCIPTKIKKEDTNTLGFNTKDDILTKSAKLDFQKNYLIALNGINKVIKVEENNGNYVIHHDNKPGYKYRYIALVVSRIGFDPKFILDSPKKPFLYD